MADRITPNSGTKAVSSPDGKGQGCTSTKRAYVKPELILLYGNEGAGNDNAKGTKDDKYVYTKESITPTTGDHYGPS